MQNALLNTMSRQIEGRCQQVLAAAQHTAGAIVSETREKAAKRRADTLDRTQREVDRLAERMRQLAALQAEQDALSMRQKVSDEVLHSVETELARMAASPEFPAILEDLLAEVMKVAPESAEIIAPVAHAQRCRQWLAAHGYGHVNVLESTSLEDGVSVQDAQRSIRITNSLSSRFRKLEDQARKVCLQTLFGGTA